MSMVIGLTGGIGSGKTTVADLFAAQYGIDIIDADIVAREVVAPNSQGLQAICERFGATILMPDGTLDRKQLRELIFSNPEHKTWLDALLHPMIRARMQQELSEATSPYCLFVVPLMVENNLQTMADRLLVVDVDPQQQIQRTQARDQVSSEQVENIISAQASRQQRLDAADDIINNNGSKEQLLARIAQLHQQYLTLSQSA